MEVISVINPKGGVGKTTVAGNLAMLAAKNGKNVLVIDLDPNRSFTRFLDIDNDFSDDELVKKSAASMFSEDPMMPSDIAVKTKYGYDLVMGSYDMLECEEFLIKNVEGFAHFYDLFDEDTNLESNYDYIIVDTGGRVGRLMYAIVFASDRILVPTTLSKLSIDQLEQIFPFVEQVQKMKKRLAPTGGLPHVSHVLINNVDQRERKLISSGIDNVVEVIPNSSLICDAFIPRAAAVGNGENINMHVVGFEPSSQVSKAFLKAYNEILEVSANESC